MTESLANLELLERYAPFLADYLLMIVIILMGSITNAFVQLKAARETQTTFDFIDFFIALFIAAFSGMMFAIGAAYFSVDTLVHHGVSGAGAFLGLTGLNKLTDALLEIISQRARKEGV